MSVASGPGSNSSTAQGVILGNSQSKFSVKDIAGIESSEENINSTSATSSSSGVSVSAIQVFGNRISAVNREMGAITLFLNAIPTHEISRAVPFIDMVLVQEGSNFTFDNKLNNLSMGRFLLGNAQVGDDNPLRTYLGARDSVLVREDQENASFLRTSETADGETVRISSPISTAGNELFTTPQTLVPGS